MSSCFGSESAVMIWGNITSEGKASFPCLPKREIPCRLVLMMEKDRGNEKRGYGDEKMAGPESISPTRMEG